MQPRELGIAFSCYQTALPALAHLNGPLTISCCARTVQATLKLRPQRIEPKLQGASTYEPTPELFSQHSSQALIESGIGTLG